MAVDNVEIVSEMEKEWLSRREESFYSSKDVLDWKRFVHEDMARLLKHEEGSKLTVDKNIIDESRKIIDISVEEVKELEEDANKQG